MSKETLSKTRALLEDALPYPPEEVDIQFKYMFGGMGAFAKTRMFAAILGDDVAFKLPPDALNEAHAAGGAPWVYTDKGKAMKMSTYTTFPPDVIADAAQCAHWMTLAIDYVLTLPAKKPRAKKRTG
jgi:TfoX/Sxy family transcriptional regulator of competence genes